MLRPSKYYELINIVFKKVPCKVYSYPFSITEFVKILSKLSCNCIHLCNNKWKYISNFPFVYM